MKQLGCLDHGQRPKTGISPREYEYEVPHDDAEEMPSSFCEGPLLEKTRYRTDREGMLWEIDVYDGPLAGLVIAEVELCDAEQEFSLPAWIGREVTETQISAAQLLIRAAEQSKAVHRIVGIR